MCATDTASVDVIVIPHLATWVMAPITNMTIAGDDDAIRRLWHSPMRAVVAAIMLGV
jgi:hypothetical protein